MSSGSAYSTARAGRGSRQSEAVTAREVPDPGYVAKRVEGRRRVVERYGLVDVVPPAASLMSGELKSTSAVVRSARLALPANWCW